MSIKNDLNCMEDLCRMDTMGMFEALKGLPAQCSRACWDLAIVSILHRSSMQFKSFLMGPGPGCCPAGD